MMRTVVLVGVMLFSAVAAAQEALVAVVNPEKPANMSEGEVGVILDAITRELSRSKRFEGLSHNKMRPVLKEKGLERVNICPDKTCIRETGKALGVPFIVSFSAVQKDQPWEVTMTMYDVETGQGVAERSGRFNGPKSQLVLKFVPKETREFVRSAEPYASVRPVPARQGPSVADEPAAAAGSEAAPAEAAGPEPVSRPPGTPRSGRAKALLTSPAFWIPVAVAVATPIAIVAYVRYDRDDDEGDDTGGVIPFPQTPTRPETIQSP